MSLPTPKPVDVVALRQVEGEMQRLGAAADQVTPGGFCFVILAMEYDGGALSFVTNAERSELGSAVRRQAARLERRSPTEPVEMLHSIAKACQREMSDEALRSSALSGVAAERAVWRNERRRRHGG